VSDGRFKIVSGKDFGFYSSNQELQYFEGANSTPALTIKTIPDSATLTLNIAANRLISHFYNLTPNTNYTISVNGKKRKTIMSGRDGSLQWQYTTGTNAQLSLIKTN
jgi:hypothetical protein